MLRRLVIAVVAVLTLAVNAAPADARPSPSPHHAVNHLWNLFATGRGYQAYLAIEPSCRDRPDRRKFDTLSHQLHHLVSHYSAYIYTDNYSEKVNGDNARVTYVLKVDVDGYDEQLASFRGQHWILIDNRWFLAC